VKVYLILSPKEDARPFSLVASSFLFYYTISFPINKEEAYIKLTLNKKDEDQSKLKVNL